MNKSTPRAAAMGKSIHKVHFVVEGREFSSAESVQKEAVRRGGGLSASAIYERLASGVNTWAGLIADASGARAIAAAASKAAREKAAAKEKAEMAELMRRVDARKAAMRGDGLV